MRPCQNSHDLALRAGPGADARVERAGFVIGVALGVADLFHDAFNTHHPLELHPVELQGGVGVASQLLALAALVVGEPDDALRVTALDEHDARARAQVTAHGGQRHGVGFGQLCADGFAQPLVELLQRVGVRGVFVQLGALVAFAQVGEVG